MIIIYTACILNNAHKIAVFIIFCSINSTVSRAMPIVVNEAWLS